MNNNTKKLDIEKRKYQTLLLCSGVAVILFGFWSFLRLILFRYLDPAAFRNALSVSNVSIEYFEIIIYAFVIIYFLFDLSVRIYVGRSAMRVAYEKKKGHFYIIISILYLLITSALLIAAIILSTTEITSEVILSYVIELTALIAWIQIVYASIRLKQIEKIKNTIL